MLAPSFSAHANAIQRRYSVEGNQLKIEVVDSSGAVKGFSHHELIQVKKGERFYHWTTAENVDRWKRQGHIDAGEIDYLSIPTGDRQVYGAGFYVSRDPLDSSSYGPAGIVTEAQEDFFLIRRRLDSANSPEEVMAMQDGLRRVKVFGNRATENWNVFIDGRATAKVEPITAKAVLDHYANRDINQLKQPVTIESIAEKFPLEPHPALAEAQPAIQKLLLRKPLTDDEEAKLLADFFPSENIKQLILTNIPSARLQKRLLANTGTRPDVVRNALFDIDASTGGLKPGPELRRLSPAIDDLLSGKEITPELRAQLWDFIKSEHTGRESGPLHSSLYAKRGETETPFLRKLKSEFALELREGFRRAIAYADSPSIWVTSARNWGVPLSDLIPGSLDPGGTPINMRPVIPAQKQLLKLNDYGRNLAESFAFIDHYDMAREVAKGNPEPWKIYDELGKAPLLDRWKKARNVLNTSASYLDAYEALTGEKRTFRGGRVVAGGDIKLPGDPFGYARVTEEQLNALKENSFLKVYEKPDPYPQHAGKRTTLVRYEYPSAATFEQLEEQLSEKLFQDLKAAKEAGELASEHSESFQRLTKQILQELWENAVYKGSPLLNYRNRIAIHPFDDYNGRFARLFYQVENGGNPLVMPQWDLDLLSRPEYLTAERDKGETIYNKILQAFVDRQAEKPRFPRYFDSPEIFETLLDLPPEQNHARRAKHTEALREYLRSPEAGSMIRQKEITQLQWKLWDLEGRAWEKLPEAERTSTLKKWISNGFVPEFSDDKLFRHMLEESKRLARGKDEARVARWWLRIGSGLDPVHGAVLADFFRTLPSGMRQSLRREWVKGNNILNLPFRPEERAAWIAEFKQALASGVEDGLSPQRRVQHFLEQELYNPTNPKKPYGAILQLAAEHEELFADAMRDILTAPNHPKIVAAVKLLNTAPPGIQKRLAKDVAQALITLSHQHPAVLEQFKIAMRTGSPIGEEILTMVAQGHLYGSNWLEDPAIRKRLLAAQKLRPPMSDMEGRFKFASYTPERARAALQSFADRKEWNSFVRLAELATQANFLKGENKTTPAVKALIKQIESALGKADAGLGGERALSVAITRMKLAPGEPSRKAAMYTELMRALGENNRFLAQDILSLAEGPEGPIRIANVFDKVMPLGDREVVALLKQTLPATLNQVGEWKEEWGKSLTRAMKLASPEDQAALIKNLGLARGWRKAAVLAMNAAPAETQLLVLKDTSLPRAISFVALGADDPKVRQAAEALFFEGHSEPQKLANAVRGLIKDGAASVTDGERFAKWTDAIRLYLVEHVSGTPDGAVFRDDVVEAIYKSAGRVPRSEAEAEGFADTVKFLNSFTKSSDRKYAPYLASMIDDLQEKDVPAAARRIVMEKLVEAADQSVDLRDMLSTEKLLNHFEKRKDPDVLTILARKVSGQDYSPMNTRVFGALLSSPEEAHFITGQANFLSMINGTNSAAADRAEIKRAIQRAVEAIYLRGDTEAQGHRLYQLKVLGEPLGFDVPEHLNRLRAGMIPLKAGPQGITCSFQFNRLKYK